MAWFLGERMPVIGGPIFAILFGMLISLVWKNRGSCAPGIGFTSKYVLQTAVVLLGFGLNLSIIAYTGWQSLPIIIVTIGTALLLAWLIQKILKMNAKTATLIGVGSSICGGSAIAATAPVIDADDEEIAQSISVIFLFNVIAALIFPLLGTALGMSTTSGEVFGLFAGTAVNDTSSVTATAATWDTMWNLGSATLDKAVTVKLTRTLAIIPITLVLALITSKKSAQAAGGNGRFSLKRAFPQFVGWFIVASIVTTIAAHAGMPVGFVSVTKFLSKFMIIMAMGAIGLNSDIVKLIKTGGKPLLLGIVCWSGITFMSLIVLHVMGMM